MKAIFLGIMVSFACLNTAFASGLMKGADLYSWKEAGEIWYALLPGTNRLKHSDELLKAKLSSNELLNQLNQLPKETNISWNNSVGLDNKALLQLALPPQQEVKLIKRKISKLGLKLQ